MLTRIISGLLLGFLFLFLAMQSTPWVLLAFGIPYLVAQLELTSIAPSLSAQMRTLWIILSLALWGALCLMVLYGAVDGRILALTAVVVVLGSIRSIVDYEKSKGENSRLSTTQLVWPSLLIALSFVLLPMIALSSNDDYPYLLLLIGAAWTADTAGVFGGKFFGRSRLIPNLSPNKTVEGAVAGVLAGGLVWLAVPFVFGGKAGVAAPDSLDPATLRSVLFLGATGAAIAVSGIVGDLWFSLHKRLAGVKDYGSIIPGHGGVLDRFDAMLFAAPFVYLALITY